MTSFYNYISRITALSLILLSYSCADRFKEIETQNSPINFQIAINEATKVSSDADFNTSFITNDKIGVFAVKRTVAGTQALPAPTGNYANNIPMTRQADGSWRYDNAADAIYYPTDGMPLDFYAYYPYSAGVNPTTMSFTVRTDQSSATGYAGSDLLTAITTGQISPTVSLTFAHCMALVQVKVIGNTTGAEMDNSTTVKLMSMRTNTNVNLGTNSLTAPTLLNSIKMWRVEQPADANYSTSFTYRALVPAQAIDNTDPLFSFTKGKVTLGYIPQAQTLTQGNVTLYNVTLDASLNPNHIYKVGDIYPYKGFSSGIVFEISNGGLNGKILSLTEPSSNPTAWSLLSTLTGASSATNGLTNMTVIASEPTWQTNYPAFYTSVSQGGGWYLPAKDELKSLFAAYCGLVLGSTVTDWGDNAPMPGYDNQTSIDAQTAFNTKITGAGGGTALSVSTYWSSTEASADNAWSISMTDGTISSQTKTVTTITTRSIKKF